MPNLYIAEHHDQVHTFWKESGARDLSVAHVDFHCDMRGLLIDRKMGTAHFTTTREKGFVDRGNFLGHAIMAGMVNRLTWIHNQSSGRAFDIGPVVAYETDYLAPYYRYLHQRRGDAAVPLDFRECLLDDWQGLKPGQQLDLDWDALASVTFDSNYQDRMISAFLERDLNNRPETSFLVYSPGYSNPDRDLFNRFAKELAQKLRAEITHLPHSDLVTDGQRFPAAKRALKSIIPQKCSQPNAAWKDGCVVCKRVGMWRNQEQIQPPEFSKAVRTDPQGVPVGV